MSQPSNVIMLPPRAGIPAAFQAAAVPDMNAAAQHGIAAGFAVIGFKGRNWRIKHRGEEKLLLDAKGIPVPTLDAVIVGVSQALSKQWYQKKFTEGDDSPPDCFSVNGVNPDAASPNKQCETCAVCPQNRWGSRVSDTGSKGKACQDTRRLAIVPYGDFKNEAYGGPMLLRLPPTSLSPLANYCRELQKFGAQPCYVRTEIGFDYNVAYPLITFKAAGWLSDEDSGHVVEVIKDPLIERMLETEVVEATHDPALDASPLAQGGPAKAFVAQPAQKAPEPVKEVAKPAAAAATLTPTMAPAPPVPAAVPEPVQEEDEEAQLMRQLEEARARKAQPQAQKTAAPAKVEAEAKPVAVQPAPEDLEAAIDSLLAG